MSIVKSKLPPTTEGEFMAQLRQLSQLCGWAWYHPWLSIHSVKGWPDIALVRPPRFILAELKSEKGKLTPDQEMWLGLLKRCPGIEVYVWRPGDLDKIIETLIIKKGDDLCSPPKSTKPMTPTYRR